MTPEKLRIRTIDEDHSEVKKKLAIGDSGRLLTSWETRIFRGNHFFLFESTTATSFEICYDSERIMPP